MFKGFNSIIYGHNMIDKLMFSDILNFSDQNYLASHDKGYLVLDNDLYKLNFFAYLDVPSTAAAFHTVFMTKQEQDDYIDYIFSAAKYTYNYTDDELKNTDDLHIILFSTCSFQYDESRGILFSFFTENNKIK